MKMSIEEVRNWLEHYIDYRGKIAFIETQIEWMQKEIDDIRAAANMSEDEFKESLGMSKTQFSDMPPSVTNSFNSKTETAALNADKVIEREMAEISKELINKYNEMAWHKKSIYDLKRRVKTVDGWLDNLKEKQLFIINLAYVKGLALSDIMPRFYNEYELQHSRVEYQKLRNTESLERNIKRIKKEALLRIVQMTEIKKLP